MKPDIPEELSRVKGGASEIVPVFRDPGASYINRHVWVLEEIRERDKKLDELLTTLKPSGYPSVSEADFATCVKLLYWEFDPGTCAGIIGDYRCREKVLKRPDYVERTIMAADSMVEETISDRVSPDEWVPGDVFDEIVIPEDEDE